MRWVAIIVGSGLGVGVLRATGQHYWARHLKRREEHKARPYEPWQYRVGR